MYSHRLDLVCGARTLALAVCVVAWEGPARSAGHGPVTVPDVFAPDTADVVPAAAGGLKQAVDQVGGPGAVANSNQGCAAPGLRVTALVAAAADPAFSDALGQIRADALDAALPAAGVPAGRFVAAYAGASNAEDGSVTVSANTADIDPPELTVTSTPGKGTRVVPGDKIGVTIAASERYADGHRSQPSGVVLLELVSDTEGVIYRETYPNPDPCAVPTLQVTYSVSAAPPPVVHLTAIARDAAGNQASKDAAFPTAGDYFGTLAFSSQQQVPAGMQYFDGAFAVTLTRGSKDNLSGVVSGPQSERLALAECPSDTVTPGKMSAKLNGVIKDGNVISLDVTDGSFTPPDMTPCKGGQPGKPPGAYAWPHFALVFHDLVPSAGGTYSFAQQWTNPGGGYPFTERYDLELAPAK